MNQQGVPAQSTLRKTGATLTATGQPTLHRTHFDRTPSLYRVFGRARAGMVRQPLSFSSLRHSDCSVLDAVGTIYVWEGSASLRVTRAFAHSIAIDISDAEYGSRAKVEKISGDRMARDHVRQLAKLLSGSEADIVAAAEQEEEGEGEKSSGGDGDREVVAYLKQCELYDVRGLPVMVSSGRSMSRLQLTTAKAFALVCPDELYLWLGSSFPRSSIEAARSMAETLCDQGVRVFEEREGLESIVFRHRFWRWTDAAREYFSDDDENDDDDDENNGSNSTNTTDADGGGRDDGLSRSRNHSRVVSGRGTPVAARGSGSGSGKGSSHSSHSSSHSSSRSSMFASSPVDGGRVLGHEGSEAEHAMEVGRTRSDVPLSPQLSAADGEAGVRYLSREERSKFFTFEQLQAMMHLNRLPGDVDPTSPESALKRKDFLRYFQRTPEDFASELPPTHACFVCVCVYVCVGGGGWVACLIQSLFFCFAARAELPRWSRMRESKRVFVQSDA